MATVTGITAAKAAEIEAASVVSGLVDVNGRLILSTRGGTTIDAGSVRGGKGDKGDAGVGPVGTISMYAGQTPPPRHLFCDGSEILRSGFPELFSVIGTSYGVGDGVTTFALPNLKGRVPVGRDPAQTEFDSLGDTGGAKTHTLLISEMPSHGHAISATSGGIAPAIVGANESGAATQNRYHLANGIAAFSAAANGGGGAHNNLQPFVVVNYIIRF